MGKGPKREAANSYPLSDHKTNSHLFAIPICVFMVFLLGTGIQLYFYSRQTGRNSYSEVGRKNLLTFKFRINMFRYLRNNVSGLHKYYGVKITEHAVQEILKH